MYSSSVIVQSRGQFYRDQSAIGKTPHLTMSFAVFPVGCGF